MLLLDRVVGWDFEQVEVAATPGADAWHAENGDMPSWIGVELMAQAIAAHVGLYARSRREAPKKGVFLGARSYRATQARFSAGANLTIRAQRAFRDDSGMGAYDCSISRDAVEIATARLIVLEPPDFEAFLAAQAAAPS